MQHVVACECEEGQVDEVGVDSHGQQQHRQLQQRVQTQEDGTGHHGNHTTQYKDLRGQSETEALDKNVFSRHWFLEDKKKTRDQMFVVTDGV